MPTARTSSRTRKPPPPSSSPIEEAQAMEGEGIPEIKERRRTPKLEKLEGAVAGLYIMTGGVLSTLPEQVAGARVKVIGLNVAQSSDEIAEAWIDLAEDDKRVLKALESLTSFSGWGKVVGVHLMAIGTAMPGIPAMMSQADSGPVRPRGNSSNGGAVDPQTAMILAEMFRQAQSQQRAENVESLFDERQQAQPQQQREQPQPIRRTGPVAGATRPGRNAGIPSAADLGVSIPDAPADFPTAGAENIRG